jgi:hypothetical protein
LEVSKREVTSVSDRKKERKKERKKGRKKECDE